MEKGKVKCEILKAVRKKIAASNGIPFEPNVCHHQGDCRGTCPACESEVKYLERMLGKMEASGKKPNLVGVSAGLAAMIPVAFGCSCQNQSSSEQADTSVSPADTVQVAEPFPGEIAVAPYDSSQVLSVVVGDGTELGIALDSYVEEVEEEIIEEEEEAVPYQLVEQKPLFNGKDLKEFAKWVNANIDADRWFGGQRDGCGYQGRVMVNFTIEKDGSLTGAKVLRGIDEAPDAETLRVISSSPKWTPGYINGRPVMVSITFPVVLPHID